MSKIKFEDAPMDIECRDVWQPGRFSQYARDAYDALAKAGRILPMGAKKDRAGRTYIWYRADIPHEWILMELAEARRQGRQLTLTDFTEAI